VKKSMWLKRGVWLLTAVATGVLVSLLVGGHAQPLAAQDAIKTPDGGMLAVAGGRNAQEGMFFLDANAGRLLIAEVDRVANDVSSVFTLDLMKEFKVGARGPKPQFSMVCGSRYRGVVYVYIFEGVSGEVRAYRYSMTGQPELSPPIKIPVSKREPIRDL